MDRSANEKIADQLLLSNILYLMDNKNLIQNVGIGSNDLKELARTAHNILKKDVELEEYTSEKRKLKK